MGLIIDVTLEEIGSIFDAGLDAEGTLRILKILDGPPYARELLEELILYSELLPLGQEKPYTREQRYLHFLWDAFDKLPICLYAKFGILFRRLIAEKLFSHCGAGFIAEENCRFNFGQYINIGDFVFFNRGVFIDSKGGVTIGHHVALTENVNIFTHSHSESSHIIREYHPVVIGDYAKIYTGAMIFPGVTIGEGAIVAAHSLVTKDVPSNTLVAGSPAQVVRERKTEGKMGDDLDHLWLF
ncbi:MAG: 2,3,4,5-tetrahydropyridine-2,6-dicarboxylate N-acetyltransferase [Syntrophus sp. SKADARSKE-3]|nr:2,3,4,5-tetrahydropyridine-2,6-dicarboxylate N-acetyltransferase [Syntrophus sp. SKADARSKE-3]